MARINRTTALINSGARSLARGLGGVLAIVAIAWSQFALAQGSVRLTAVEVQPMQGQTLQIRLRTDGVAPQPLTFTIDRPARLSVDLPGVVLALENRRIDVGTGGVDTIVAAEASGRTRVVFNLDSLVPYAAHADGDSVVVTIGGTATAAAAPATYAAAPSSGPRSITGVDFRRSPDGAGRVVVQLSDPATPASLRQEGNRVIVDFTGVQLGEENMKRYDVVDFATPVTMVDAARVGDNARIVVTATGDFEQLAYQTDNQYVVEVKPRAKASAATMDEKVYTGERLTLNFQDIDVRPVLQLLADTSGQNIVVSDSVKGRVTLRLQNVPWDQALDIVLRTKGLDMRRKGNVILVAPQAELAAQEKAELAAQKDIQDLAPLRTEFLQVNYAKASEIARLVKSSGGGSLLSSRGNVSVDERTNTMLVQDTAEQLTAIRSVVSTLDIPVRQVLIESRIVIVSDDFSRELGVRFGFTRVSDDVRDLMAISGSAQSTDVMMGSALDNIANNTPNAPFPVSIPFGNFDRYNVNMPVANPAGRIALSILDFDDYLIDLELSAAQNEGRGEIKSTPRVITANGREAIIEQGVEIPYQESASSGATTTQFKKAVLSLKVTPQITPDDRVILDLTVTKDSVGQLVPSATGGFVPSIDTRNIQTQVLVKDGQTVVLGGIMETERRDSVRKVPLLGDVPVLGNLFKSKTKTNNRDELLIFVTPKILREGSTIN
jgi:type IV pilus assembly protein PilQ